MERHVPARRFTEKEKRMTTIIAGRFDAHEPAERALRALIDRGFHHADTSEFFVNPPGQHGSQVGGGDQFADAQSSKAHLGAAAGATAGGAAGLLAAAAVPGIGIALAAGVVALGAYTGSFLGTMSKLGDAGDAERLDASPGRQGGQMVAVRVLNLEAERNAIDVLRAHGAQDIERHDGEWRDGEWVDFDPVSPPATIDAAAGRSTSSSPKRSE
jgi:hypothetical protein